MVLRPSLEKFINIKKFLRGFIFKNRILLWHKLVFSFWAQFQWSGKIVKIWDFRNACGKLLGVYLFFERFLVFTEKGQKMLQMQDILHRLNLSKITSFFISFIFFDIQTFFKTIVQILTSIFNKSFMVIGMTQFLLFI